MVLINFFVIRFNGTPVAIPEVPRQPQIFGDTEQQLTYVVMGDSTSVGQGAQYANSIATLSAERLATEHRVTLINVGVSGARAKDVLGEQTPKATEHRPDVVLLSVGANDVTHLTSLNNFETSLRVIVAKLKENNSDVKIIVTGSPDMGSISRFPWPARQIAGLRTTQINRIVTSIVEDNELIFAQIAAETGSSFRNDPNLFASDKFHPNARGYALWAEVINKAIQAELR